MSSSTKGAIATPHHLATRAGERVFAEGGTPVDAAIAAAAVLAVLYPHMCALGGDVQARGWTAKARLGTDRRRPCGPSQRMA